MGQSNTEVFSQIMERLDTIYPLTTAVPLVTPNINIGFSNILSRWAWVEQSVVESMQMGISIFTRFQNFIGFSVDPELVANHFAVAQQTPIM
jgi:hypothetical protein